MKRFAWSLIFLLAITSTLVIAIETTPYNQTNSTSGSNSSNITNSTPVTCTAPVCEGREEIGKDSNGCPVYACPTQKYEDMNSCLDNDNNYWDQESNKCYDGRTGGESCTDPDGMNKYESAHTFGFRSSFADSRDQRIRTGGKDYCNSKTQLSEYYCSDNGFIEKTNIDCPNGCMEGKCVKGEFISEEIKCVFKDSSEEEECYVATPGFEGKNFKELVNDCQGEGSCSLTLKEEKGAKITWKSSCGGYAYTIQDGKDETISFECTAGETTPGKIANDGFFTAYWQCYGGEEMKTSSDQCKSFLEWQDEANNHCASSCSSGKKCGINSFSVIGECYVEVSPSAKSSTGSGSSGTGSSEDYCKEYLKECKADGKISNPAACEKWEANCQETKVSVCKNSCSLDDKCYPFGYRKSNNYCSDSGSFTKQLDSGEVCENNFECGSNVCVSGQCISESLMEKIIGWFKNLFSGE
jgi:hypothetical protein